MSDKKDFIFDGSDQLWDDKTGPSWGDDDLSDIYRLLDDGEADTVSYEEHEPPAARPQPSDPAEEGPTEARQRSAKGQKKGGGKKPKKEKRPSKPAKEPKPQKPTKEPKPPKEKGRKKKKKEEQEDISSLDLPSISGRTEQRSEEKLPKGEPPKDKKHWKLSLAVFIVVLSLIAAGATVGGYMVTIAPNSFPRVYIGENFVGDMGAEQIRQVLDQAGWEKTVSTSLKLHLPADVTVKVDSQRSGAKLSCDKAVEAALSYGKSGNIYQNLFQYVLNWAVPVDLAVVSQELDQGYIKNRVEESVKKVQLASATRDYELDLEEGELCMMKGAGEIQLDRDALYQSIAAALAADSREIVFDQLSGTITMPDFDALYEELAKQPQDAQFTDEFEILPEVVGCAFNVEEAKRLWREADPGDIISIPLDVTWPETTEASLQALLYRDKLGSCKTYYKNSGDNRIGNIALATEKINGLILLPGEVFSFNERVGQRTAEAGFTEAGAYDSGQVVQELGGGICQVSSTLYSATMYAQMETVSRTNHYFKVDYLDMGMDATVSWQKPDFKFKNCRDLPVKIVAYNDFEEKSLTIEIWGTDVDGSYVELRTTKLVVYDQTYTNTAVGYGVSTYRMIYDAEGNYLYEIEEPYGVYYRHDDEIQWPPEKYAADAAAGG